MRFEEFLEKYWSVLKIADEFSMDLYGLNLCETLVKDMKMQDYNDMLKLIEKKRNKLLGVKVL